MLIRKSGDADACPHIQKSQRTNQAAWWSALPVGSQGELGGDAQSTILPKFIMAEEKACSLRIQLWFDLWFCCFEVLVNHLTLLAGWGDSAAWSLQWEEHLFPDGLWGG